MLPVRVCALMCLSLVTYLFFYLLLHLNYVLIVMYISLASQLCRDMPHCHMLSHTPTCPLAGATFASPRNLTTSSLFLLVLQ